MATGGTGAGATRGLDRGWLFDAQPLGGVVDFLGQRQGQHTVVVLGFGLSGIDLGGVFQMVFIAAGIGFALALTFIALMEERPLRGSAVKAAEAAIAD